MLADTFCIKYVLSFFPAIDFVLYPLAFSLGSRRRSLTVCVIAVSLVFHSIQGNPARVSAVKIDTLYRQVQISEVFS